MKCPVFTCTVTESRPAGWRLLLPFPPQTSTRLGRPPLPCHVSGALEETMESAHEWVLGNSEQVLSAEHNLQIRGWKVVCLFIALVAHI